MPQHPGQKCCTKDELVVRFRRFPAVVDVRSVEDLRIIAMVNGHCLTWHRESTESDWICEEL